MSDADAQARLARDGPNEIAQRRAHPVLRFAAELWGLTTWMLETIALALLAVNAVIGLLQEQRASVAVAALRQRMQVSARVRHGGDFVPAGVRVLDGTRRLDPSPLTGESRDIDKAIGDPVRSGSIVRAGEATAAVTATGAATYFGRTTQFVGVARPKLHVEAVITRVVRWRLAIVGAQDRPADRRGGCAPRSDACRHAPDAATCNAAPYPAQSASGRRSGQPLKRPGCRVGSPEGYFAYQSRQMSR